MRERKRLFFRKKRISDCRSGSDGLGHAVDRLSRRRGAGKRFRRNKRRIFDFQTVGSIIEAVKKFQTKKFDSAIIKNSVQKFDKKIFQDKIKE